MFVRSNLKRIFVIFKMHRVEDMQRIVGRMPSSKLAEEHVMQQAVHRLPHLLFHHHLQQDEIDATVFVLAPHAEARVLDLLDNGVFKRVVQIHVTGDLCRKARLFPGRYQIGKKREVVAHIGPGVETDRMRLVLRIAVQAAFITILVDRVQVLLPPNSPSVCLLLLKAVRTLP